MTQIRTGGGCKTVISGRRLRGTYVSQFNPNSGLPTTGSGQGGAILKGDFWDASVLGTIIGLNIEDLEAGDLLFAKINGASVVGDFIVNKAEGGGSSAGFQGLWNASGNSFPSSANVGDEWDISVGGNLLDKDENTIYVPVNSTIKYRGGTITLGASWRIFF